MRPGHKRRAGVTLAELMIACSLLVLVAAVAFTLLQASLSIFKHGEDSLSSQNQIRAALLTMVEDIRSSREFADDRYVFDGDRGELTDTYKNHVIAVGLSGFTADTAAKPGFVRLTMVSQSGLEISTTVKIVVTAW